MLRVTWSRPEPFGAWVRLDDETLLAVDGELADRMGVAREGPLPARTRPLELHLAVTSRCPAPCTGCYLDARPDGFEPSFEALAERLSEARDAGVSIVAFGGGEPLTRTDLGRLAEAARALNLVPVLTTSGLGMTPTRARELGAFAQINVSHDGVGGAYEAVRGFDAVGHAERAIAWLVEAGVSVGVNLVLTRQSFPHVEATLARVKALGAGEIQLLRYKPAGRADATDYAAKRLVDAQVSELFPLVQRLVATGVGVRIDCAMVPLLSESLLEAVPDAPAALAELGVFGCEAARHLGALAVDGSPRACSFFTLSESKRASKLVRARRALAFADAWDGGADLEALRSYHAAPAEPCASCALFPVCRGGCQVVSRRASSSFAPDPECPRVKRHALAAEAPSR